MTRGINRDEKFARVAGAARRDIALIRSKQLLAFDVGFRSSQPFHQRIDSFESLFISSVRFYGKAATIAFCVRK